MRVFVNSEGWTLSLVLLLLFFFYPAFRRAGCSTPPLRPQALWTSYYIHKDSDLHISRLHILLSLHIFIDYYFNLQWHDSELRTSHAHYTFNRTLFSFLGLIHSFFSFSHHVHISRCRRQIIKINLAFPCSRRPSKTLTFDMHSRVIWSRSWHQTFQ